MSAPKTEAERKALDLAMYREWRRLQGENHFVAAEFMVANQVSVERGRELAAHEPTPPEAA